jgi:3-oxoacyl-[acyl-carrier-protein] synthase II
MSALILAVGAVSGLGLGESAYVGSSLGEPARCAIARDAELESSGLLRPFAARAPTELGVPPRADRATALLDVAFAQVLAELAVQRPDFRSERLGIALGTSSGGMLTAERFFVERERTGQDAASPEVRAELARGATYFAPFDDALARVGLADVPLRTQILAACAASAVALGVGLRWLDRGACDVVLAGGYDALSLFVAAGFEALRATTASRPRPFGLGRDGMSLGEGAALVALVREGDQRGARVRGRVAGFGAATDAVHITAPDRTGSGLARAARAALVDAQVDAAEVGLVSAHGTSTPFNDAMESKAIGATFGSPMGPVTHPFKAQIGHTLGAAGVLESLAALHALATQTLPAAVDPGELDPDAPARLLALGERGSLRAAVKLSAAFGGANAAVVLSAEATARAPRPPRAVYLRAIAHAGSIELAALALALGVPMDRLGRLDTLARLSLAAVAALAVSVGADTLRGAGIVAGQALATLDTNARFDARRRARGPRAVEPRLFPATSPNAAAGECAIQFELTGPSFAVGAGLAAGLEALSRAAELVAARDCERVVVLVADDAGPAARDLLAWSGQGTRALAEGAVACLLDAEPRDALAPIPLDLPVDASFGPIGHLGLLAWLAEATRSPSSADPC